MVRKRISNREREKKRVADRVREGRVRESKREGVRVREREERVREREMGQSGTERRNR